MRKDQPWTLLEKFWNAYFQEGKQHRLMDVAVSTSFDDARSFRTPRDPLVLDVDGDGIEATAIDPNALVLFDHNGEGIRQATGWIKADDGIVVLDRDGNGIIDSGRELFGDNTLLANGHKAADAMPRWLSWI